MRARGQIEIARRLPSGELTRQRIEMVSEALRAAAFDWGGKLALVRRHVQIQRIPRAAYALGDRRGDFQRRGPIRAAVRFELNFSLRAYDLSNRLRNAGGELDIESMSCCWVHGALP